MGSFMITNQSIPYDLCAHLFMSHRLAPIEHSVNQEKALAGAFSVIVKTDGSFAALICDHQLQTE